ncbi:MAG: isoprenylcysteine carboxylmethyltransferase family protein [Bryobacterales bacterium]|nr:isoprenylcysteine carboxylmethyltransferase family protein [Bryobacterales bacterium]
MLRFAKPYADCVARLRVPSGFLLVAAFGWFSDPDAASLAAGLPVALCGLLLRAWAAGHLDKNRKLATGGPYACTRNPLYIGTLLVAAGLAIASRRSGLALLFGAIFVLVYLPAIQLEEQHLRKLFPEYARYAERVPALWPRRARYPAAEKFQFALYMKNKEYQALAGFAAGALFLIWKALM